MMPIAKSYGLAAADSEKLFQGPIAKSYRLAASDSEKLFDFSRKSAFAPKCKVDNQYIYVVRTTV